MPGMQLQEGSRLLSRLGSIWLSPATGSRDLNVTVQPLQKPKTLPWLRTEDLAHTVRGDTGV